MEKRDDKMTDIESLLKSKDIDGSRWFPIGIDRYRNNMKFGYFKSMEYHYKSNIAYSLQYLEFLLFHKTQYILIHHKYMVLNYN
jgi:hypothetical protein